MAVYNIIILIGSIATALFAIGKLAFVVYKKVKEFFEFFKRLCENVDTLMTHDKDQYLAILRLTVVSTDMPMSERLSAGEAYVDKGGNGDVKHLYEDLKNKVNHQE